MFDLVITLCLVFGGVLNTVGATLGMQGLRSEAIACLIIGCAFMTVAVITQIADICNKSKAKEKRENTNKKDAIASDGHIALYSRYCELLNSKMDEVWRLLHDNGICRETTLVFDVAKIRYLLGEKYRSFIAVVYYHNGKRIDLTTDIPVEKPTDFNADTDIKVISNTENEVKFEYDKTLYLIDKASGNCHVIVSTKENKK